MLFILLSIFFSSLITIIFKLYKTFEIDTFQAIVINYFVCLTTGFFLTGEWAFAGQVWEQPWFRYSILLGLIFISSFYMIALTVQHFGITFTAIMQKMSVVLTILFTILVYNESAGIVKIIGIICALAAIYLINKPDKDFNLKQFKGWLILLPTFTFLSNGIIEIILFIVETEQIAPNGDFRFISFNFFTAGMLGMPFLLFKVAKGQSKFQWKNFLAGIALGVPNFFSIYYMMKILTIGMEGSVVFPINNVGILIFSALIGFLVFKEKITSQAIIGLILAILAIGLIAY
jgi:uncharacterized membrane protein